MSIDVQSIRQRVKESGLFTQVRGVVSLADAVRNPGSVGKTAFVVIPKETAEPSRTIGAHRQRIPARVAITFPLQAQAVAMDRSDEVEAMRSTIKSHMAGWSPTGAETALEYSYSEISSIQSGFVWVNVFFDCRYLFSAEHA